MKRDFLLAPMFLAAVLAVLPLRAADILPPDAQPERLATGFGFTEGPVYDGAGGVLFTDLNASDIIRYDIASKSTKVVDGNSGRANGLFLDALGRVVAAEGNGPRGGAPRISVRSADDIAVVDRVLADQWNGVSFNQPNDLVIDSQGGVYFTDPDYGGRRAQAEAVYYVNRMGELTQILSGFRRPNGIILSPDGQTLYLAVEAERRIMAYDVGADGLPTNEREFARTDVDRQGNRIRGISNGPDGFTVDPAGNLYAAVQNSVWSWTPSGERLFELDMPENPTNLAFGGENGTTLFITARSSLYGINLNIVPAPTSVSLLWLGVLGLLGRRPHQLTGTPGLPRH